MVASYSQEATEQVIHGAGAAGELARTLDALGHARAFVITGTSLAGLRDGPVQRALAVLGPRVTGLHHGIRAHTPCADVLKAAQAARAARADVLLAIGGGSVIDAAKGVQWALRAGCTREEDFDPAGMQAALQEAWPPDAVRTIALSTTLSAAEFTSLAGITDRHRRKQIYQHRMLVPRCAVLDPEATLATPPWLLLSTGVRALDHAVESYGSVRATEMSRMWSLHGFERLMAALPRIHQAPEELAPRAEAQIGMWQAINGMACGAGTGASHAIGYALGASFDVPHGHTSCVMLPAVLAWNAATDGAAQRRLSQALGAQDRPLADTVRELVRALGLPVRLRDLRPAIPETALDAIAEAALAYAPLRLNPRPVHAARDVREILALAW